MKDILNFMDDLYQSVQTEGVKYSSAANDLHLGINLSSKIIMTKTRKKDNRCKICIWDPKQFQNGGLPHLVISLNPYSCGPEITGKNCSFNSKFNLDIERIAHESTNGLLNIFIDNIVSKAMKMIDKYDRGGTDEKVVVEKKNSLALKSFEQATFSIDKE